jgi:hypothetical protein
VFTEPSLLTVIFLTRAQFTIELPVSSSMILSPPVSGGMLWYGLVQPRLATKPVPVQPAAAPAPRKLLSDICVSCLVTQHASAAVQIVNILGFRVAFFYFDLHAASCRWQLINSNRQWCESADLACCCWQQMPTYSHSRLHKHSISICITCMHVYIATCH